MRVISKLYALCQISVLLCIGVQARPSKDSNLFKSLFNHELSERDANDESKAFQEWVTREHGSNNEDSDHVVNVDDGGASLSDNPPGNIVITNDDKKNDDYDYEGKVDGDYEDDDQGGDDNDDQGEDDGDYEDDDQGEDGDYEDENQGEADGDYEDDDQGEDGNYEDDDQGEDDGDYENDDQGDDGDYKDDDQGEADGDYEDDDQGEDDGDYEDDDQGEDDGDYKDDDQGIDDGDYEDDDQVNKDGPHPFNFEDNPDISASDIIYQVNSNAGLMHNTFEEDILIDPSRVQEVASWGAENDITKRMPTSVNNREYRWPGGLVPYKIDSTFLRDHKSNTQQLEAAKAEYASKTCIKLEELPPGRQSYHVNLISDSGCYSYIGRLSGISGFSQSQDISIGIGCNFKSTIVHEFLHALGFWHEQSRPDRDDYVTILWQNIRRGVENNFQKHGSEKTTNLGVEYDYESVMHYGRTAFSVNGQPTIIRKDNPEGALGQLAYGGLSAKDAEEINIFYNCKTPGTTAPPPATPSTTPPTTPSTTPPTTPSTSPPPTIEIESGVRVFIKSVGCYDPGVTNCDTTEAVIKVNDAVMSCPNPKGACLTILDGVTGEIEETINEMSTNLVDYLPMLSSKPKKLILGTVKGTWSTPRDRRSLRILRRYLYRLRVFGRRVYFRNASFAFIGWSGPGRVSVTRGVYTNARRGPSVISRKIYFPLA